MLKNKKQLLLLFLVISLLFAGLATYLISKNTYKYNIVHQKEAIGKGFSYIYHDFDKDGNSEKYFLHNYEKTSSSAILFSINGQHKKQFNFIHPLEIRTVCFDDYNGDMKDEMILFTKKGDSLFVSIVDLISLDYIIHEELIFKRTPINNYKEWDYFLKDVQFIKTDTNKRQLLFALNSGFSFYPRGIYLYDVENKIITKKFENDAAKIHISLIDLNKNGYKEIVVSGMAPSNGSPFSKYSDSYCWLFVLDKNLNLFWEPIKTTTHPSSHRAFSFTHKNEKFILSSNYGSKNCDDWIGIRILDKNGKIVNQLKITNHELCGKVEIFQEAGLSYFLTTTKSGYVKLYNFNFNLLNSKKISNSNLLRIIDIIDVENDGINEYLFYDNNYVIVTNNSFDVIAKYKYEFQFYYGYLSYLSYKKSNNSNLVIGSRSENHYNLLSFHESKLHGFIPFLFPILTILIFGILYFSHRIGQQISRHYSVHNFFIKKDDSALLLFSPEERVKAYNNQFQTLFGIKSIITKNEKLDIILEGNKSLLKIINDSKQNESQTRLEFRTNTNRVGIITISPLKSKWGFVYAYIFEFSDSTEPIISDRQKLWSTTSQKIAHDIKTPLSTIQLNLAALSKRIDDEEIPAKEGFRDDISMIRSEINRIRSLTQGFLKFANLDKPHFQIVSIKEIIEKSLQQFHSYTKDGVKIATSFSKNEATIFADPLQIEQLFHIIIENSIDSMEGKGIIEIKTELAQKMNYQEFLQIEFTDNGKGIEQEKVIEIFEPYYTTKKDGTGLGLAIAKKIVEDNNGEISLYSKLGFGTTVTVLLPIGGE